MNRTLYNDSLLTLLSIRIVDEIRIASRCKMIAQFKIIVQYLSESMMSFIEVSDGYGLIENILYSDA